jgi:hypothetical protein
MAITLIINGTSYEYPTEGGEPPWGSDAADWAQAATDALSGISSTGDILTTTFNPLDAQSSVQNITGFSFDGSVLNGFIAEYSIYRTDGATGYSECGNLFGAYNTQAGTWAMAQTGAGITSTGVIFSITNTGQIQYTSTSLGGTHSCLMTFRARGFKNS